MRSLLFLVLVTCINVAYSQSVDSTRYVLGKMEYASHPDFAKVPMEIANKEGMYLRKEALDAFKRMQAAAKKDGILLVIISASRNFNHQKGIWEAKWNGQRLVNGQNLKTAVSDPASRAKEILKYSSMPGTSRHHWGTDIDINSLNSNYFKTGKGKKEYEWLRDNALEFGFCQVYSEKGSERLNGYEEEEWHWSFMPLSSRYLAYYKRNIKQTDIHGFDGADALPFSEIRKYVLGISTDCK